MLLIGLSWLIFWSFIEVFGIALLKSALAVGLIYLVLGLWRDEIPKITRS